jgi:hypothetical protein
MRRRTGLLGRIDQRGKLSRFAHTAHIFVLDYLARGNEHVTPNIGYFDCGNIPDVTPRLDILFGVGEIAPVLPLRRLIVRPLQSLRDVLSPGSGGGPH